MKLIVGLGNPGEKYRNTRHNIGFVVLDKLQTEISKSEILNPKQILAFAEASVSRQNSKFKIQKRFEAEIWEGNGVILVKPQTFMNKSGEAARKIMQNATRSTSLRLRGRSDSRSSGQAFKMQNLYVIHDDLDIPLGKYKMQLGKGPKVHNGVISVEQALGTKEFWRVRIGVDNRTPKQRQLMDGEKYVLGNFSNRETVIVKETIGNVVSELKKILFLG